MKLINLCLLLFPTVLAASTTSRPTTTYADLLLLQSCTVGDYTLSDFTFSSEGLNAQSTPSVASEFGVSSHDAVYLPNDHLYLGLNFIGAPSSVAGQSAMANFGFTAAATDGSDLIQAVASGTVNSTGDGGTVTVQDSGTNAVLTTVGPESIREFNIDVTDLADVAVPEPGTWALTGLALGALFLLARYSAPVFWAR